jgi:beta-aspartyl-peptidase (threonine type)
MKNLIFKKIISVMAFLQIFYAISFCQSKNFVLVLHGGAGAIKKENMTPELEKQYTGKLNEALEKGKEILSGGGTALDAVEQVIRIMEDSPLFNAGKGAVFTRDGRNELDASIMDGKTGKAGAVGCVDDIQNPISAARMVMDSSEHVLLIGKGASKFAREHGLRIVDSTYFYSGERWEQLQEFLKKEKESGHGTVGCAALDTYGNLAAGTSTGGLTGKRWGRVGDTPVIGAGTYANNKTCAVSCTGHGEYFMRNVVAYDVSAVMEYKGLSLSDAANYVIMEKLTASGGTGGLIAVDKSGNIAMVFNTPGMFRAFVKSDGTRDVKIYK